MFVCSPDWLKISMYLELSQPLNDPSRLEKVYKRLNLFEKHFEHFTKNACLENNKQ